MPSPRASGRTPPESLTSLPPPGMRARPKASRLPSEARRPIARHTMASSK